METLHIEHVGDGTFILGDHTEAVEYLARMGATVDLVVCDPDYRNIGKDLKTEHYVDVRRILRSGCPMLHYTYNASGNRNCKMAAAHELVPALIKRGFRYKDTIFWNKYNGQKLHQQKLSHRNSTAPNDTDLLIITLKSKSTFPEYVNMEYLCKGSSIIYHQADQKRQYKPQSLCTDIVLALTPLGGTVLDTHMGNGALSTSCQITGRSYVGIESCPELFYKAVHEARVRLDL